MQEPPAVGVPPAAGVRRASGVALCMAISYLGHLAYGPPQALAGGFDRAISTATTRVVKLYGLGAGVQAGYGTGVLVSEDGLVLTVLSLLIDAPRVRAISADGVRYQAEVVYRDRQRQLALLQLRPWERRETVPPPAGARSRNGETLEVEPMGVGPFPFFEVNSGTPMGYEDGRHGGQPLHGTAARELSPGDWVIAAGNAFKVAEGAEPVSITHGVFSTRTRLDARRRVKEFPYRGEVLVIDAITSNPGAPGSAVVDLEGRFVGMIGRVVVSNKTHTHFNYAMPRDVLEQFLGDWRDRMKEDGLAAAPSEGVRGAERVRGINAKSSRSPGVGEVRDPPVPPWGREGKAADSLPKSVDYGIRLSRTGYRKVLPFVERVRRKSPAARADLRKDDLILSVNGHSVTDVEQYDASIKALGPGDALDLVIRRQRAILRIIIKPEEH